MEKPAENEKTNQEFHSVNSPAKRIEIVVNPPELHNEFEVLATKDSDLIQEEEVEAGE